jgi:hypothetical protein
MDNDKKLIELKNLIESSEISLQQARKILIDLVGSEEEKMLAVEAKSSGKVSETEEGQVIEGVFDGQNMVGPDAKKYSVPANYASKSKLVEGDGLKLTITGDGSFVYKQINLLDRDRIVGDLVIDGETNEYRVLANNKSYKVLTASVTYFKGEEGDKATILVPKGRESTWSAVENIIKAGQQVVAEPEVKSEVVEDAAAESKEEVTDESKGDEFLSGDATETTEVTEEKTEEAPAEIKPEEVPTEAKLEETKVRESAPVETIPTEEKPSEVETAEEKPKDIFEATESVETDDVKQVDIEPPSTEETNHDQSAANLINQTESNPVSAQGVPAQPSVAPQDNQGLEEI